jgi:hypothetical protein
MAFVLFVPMLLAILPSPVSAEEAALYRDLQSSRCLAQRMPLHDSNHDCERCVLCQTVGVPQLRATVDRLPIFCSFSRTAKVSFIFECLNRAELAAMVLPDPGRGPPNVSSI